MDSGQGFHLDAGLSVRLDGAERRDRMPFVVEFEVDGRLGHRQRMRHRDELRRLLDGHDAGDTGHAQYIALFGGAFVDRLHDFRRDHDGAFGRSGTRRHRFFGDIDHTHHSL